jgi:hypothetical protein
VLHPPINSQDDVTMVENMTAQQIYISEVENDRREQGRRIQAALSNKNCLPINVNLEPNDRTEASLQDNDKIAPARYREIVQFLKSHRQELALDTMHFPMAEHVILSHIKRSGLGDLTAIELRAFLKGCNTANRAFVYVVSEPLFVTELY